MLYSDVVGSVERFQTDVCDDTWHELRVLAECEGPDAHCLFPHLWSMRYRYVMESIYP